MAPIRPRHSERSRTKKTNWNQNAKTYPYPQILAKFRPSKIRPVSRISGICCALRAQHYVLILETGRIFEGWNLAKFRG